MKRIIGVFLAMVLVASGLGGFVYAQTDPNQVHADFGIHYRYRTAGDSANNPTTNQPTHIRSGLHNNSDSTGQIVVNPVLDLSSTQTVTQIKQEYLVPDSEYKWEFPDIQEDEGRGAHADIDEIVEVSTGLSVSRTVNQTSFPSTGGTQILTLNVTPVEAMDRLEVHGRTDVDGLDIATVTLVSGSPGIEIRGDGRGFHVHIDEPIVNDTYQWQITINIGSLPPEFPPVEFEYMPRIDVQNVDFIDNGEFYGSNLSGEARSLDGTTLLGTWTWQATGDYSWRWDRKVSKSVELDGYVDIQLNQVHAGFETAYRYRTAGDSVANPTTNQPTHLNSWLHNNSDSTGQVVTNPILELSSTQTVTDVRSEYLVPSSEYRWEFPGIGESESFGAHADIDEIVEVSTGLSVSRTVNQARFPPAGGTQVLTLSVTPLETMEKIEVHGKTDVDGLDIATVTAVSGDSIRIKGDGRGFDAWIDEPTVNVTYQWQITINIGPLPSEYLALEYMPRIHVSNVDYTDGGNFYGSNLSGELRSLDETVVLGTWTWQATGNYWWRWDRKVSKRVELDGYAMHSYVVAPTEKTVDDAIGAGLAWLRTQQHEDGSWYWGQPGEIEAPNVGVTGLAVWSFLHHGAPDTDSEVADGIQFMLSRQNKNPSDKNYGAFSSWGSPPTYETAIAILALRATNNPIYVDEIKLAADYLARSQNDEDVVYPHFPDGIGPDNWAYGGWGYHYGFESTKIKVAGEEKTVDPYVWSDLSSTQFAMIGLKAAEEAGFQLTPPESWESVWSKAQVFVTRCQNPDGGFTYRPGWELEPKGGSYGSMTAAGVWSLRVSGVEVEDSRVQAGLAWLDSNPFYDRNPPHTGHWHYYFLWSAAKAFTISDRPPVLVENTWYYDYAGYLLAYQQEDGSWVNPNWGVDLKDRESHLNRTEFALLVLEKAVLPPPPPPPPPVAEAGGPYLVEVGLPLTLDGSGSLPGDPERQIEEYYWIFGDGKTGSGDSVAHTYNTTGVYTAQLMVADNLSAVGADSAMVVVYDPDAGFATGGGWFIPDKVRGDELPGLSENNTSPAEFGFVVKYKPGATELGGQLEFQYRQGNFNLHSKGMEWLVIVNNNWAKFQGTATIKGFEGLYPFRVDARDGDFSGGTKPDRFIIKIYAPGSDPDQSDPIYKASGDLEGGSIVIHAKKIYTLRVQSGFPADFLGYQVFEQWAETISKESGGRLQIEAYPAGAIVPTSEMFDAVQSGVLDGFVHVSFQFAGKHALANYLTSYPFGLDEPYMWETWFYDRGGIELAREDYARFNMHYVGPVMGPSEYAHSVKPLYTMEDWNGLKSRYAGGMNIDVFDKAGAEVIWLPGGEVYQAMKEGRIELGELSSHYTNRQLGLHEVGPYIIGPGQMHSAVSIQAFVVNMDVWNSLSPKLQQLLTTGVSDLSTSTFDAYYTADLEALNWMVEEAGVTYLELPAEERAKFRLISVELWREYATDAISLQAVESQILLMSEEGLLDFPGVKEEVELYFPGLLP